MDLTPSVPEGWQVIESYGAGRFRVSGLMHSGSILVFQERTLPWPVGGMSDLTMDSFAEVIAAEPAVEILLLGCGERLAFLALNAVPFSLAGASSPM